MAYTNVLLAQSSYTLSAAGVCGASVVISAVLSAPADNAYPHGRFTVMITNEGTTIPLHVEPRIQWTNRLGSTITVPLTIALFSNTQPYGSAQSAVQAQSLLVLLSGQDACLPLEGVAGSVIQVAIMTASNPASATVVSGDVAIWRL